MRRFSWSFSRDAEEQVSNLATAAEIGGFLTIEIGSGGDGADLAWTVVEPWTRSRAVTLAVVDGEVASPALDVALCSDLVYLRPGSRLRLAVGPGPPSPGVIWALGRAGRRALARGLLFPDDVQAEAAVELGLAHSVVPRGELIPLPEAASAVAAMTARDLVRAAAVGSAGLALELAAFRLLFASGEPEEGATAFVDKRPPEF